MTAQSRDALAAECAEVLREHHEFIAGSDEDTVGMRPAGPTGECAVCEDDWPCWAVRVSEALVAVACIPLDATPPHTVESPAPAEKPQTYKVLGSLYAHECAFRCDSQYAGNCNCTGRCDKHKPHSPAPASEPTERSE